MSGPHATQPAAKGAALVVDDDAQVRRQLVRMLERGGYRCVDAADAREAWAALAREAFDVAVCDMHMPGQTGLSLIRELGERHPGTATVLITGIAHPDIEAMATMRGAAGVIFKPFRPEQLTFSVEAALSRHRAKAAASRDG